MTEKDDAIAVVGARHTMKELVDGTIRVQIDIDPPYREAFLKYFSEIGVAVGLVRLNEGEAAEPAKQAPKKKPYGEYAAELHRLGWWWQPGVLEAIGSDAQFLEWIRQQPCAMTGVYDRSEDAHGNEINRCEAAHVRRIANGAGVAIKPPYSAIPLIRKWHDAQTRYGEGVFVATVGIEPPKHGSEITDEMRTQGRRWMERQRENYVIAWASETLARALGAESMGYVEPAALVAWADKRGLTLPKKYQHISDPQRLSQPDEDE